MSEDSDRQEGATRQLGFVAEKIEERQELMLYSQKIMTPTEFMEEVESR